MVLPAGGPASDGGPTREATRFAVMALTDDIGDAVNADGPTLPAARISGFARLTRDLAVFATGAIAGKLVGLLLLPIITRALGPVEYGRLDLLSTMGSASITILWLGTDVALVRLLAELPDGSRARTVITSFFALLGGLLLPWIAALVLFAAPLSEALFGTTAYAGAMQAVALVIATGTFQIATLTVFRARRQPREYALVVGTSLVVNGIGVIALLAFWAQDAQTVLLAWAASQGIAGVIGLLVLGRSTFGPPSRDLARQLLWLGLPLVPAVALTWAAEFVNRAILSTGAGLSEVGYLSVAVRIASLATLVVSGFQLAWQPQAFAIGTSPSGLHRTARDGERILVLLSLVVALIGVVGPELVLVLAGTPYAPAIAAVGPMLVAALGTGLVMVAAMPWALAKQMSVIGVAGAAGATLSIALNLVLAPSFGSGGTAVAIALGQLIAATAMWWAPGRRLDLPVGWPRVLVVMIGAAAVAVLSTAIAMPLLLQFSVFVALILATVALGYATDWIALLRRWRRRT